MDTFLASYLETALWSSTDGDGIPLDDSKYANAEPTKETITSMLADCAKFEKQALSLIAAYNEGKAVSEEFSPRYGHLAHDFWLTRNHHGAGFWDGDYPEPLATQLTDLAHSFKECDLYIDNGKIYL